MSYVFRPPWQHAAQAAARLKRRGSQPTTATPAAGAESYPSQQKVVSIFRKPTTRVFRTIQQGPDWRDVAVPTLTAGPTIHKYPDGRIDISSTWTDVTAATVDIAFVVLTTGASAPATAQDIFDQTNNAASPLLGSTITGRTSGASHQWQSLGPLDAGTYDLYVAARDAIGNYSAVSSVLTFTIVLSLFVNVLPQMVVRHAGRYR